jgi:hypothetical protein
MDTDKHSNRKPSRYGAWIAGLLLGGIAGAGPWMYAGVGSAILLSGAVAGALAGLAGGMLWARRMLMNLSDDTATRGELIAAAVGWGAISAAGSVLLYWFFLYVLNSMAAGMFLQAGYFALLAAMVAGGLFGFIAGSVWIRITLDPGKKKKY